MGMEIIDRAPRNSITLRMIPAASVRVGLMLVDKGRKLMLVENKFDSKTAHG